MKLTIKKLFLSLSVCLLFAIFAAIVVVRSYYFSILQLGKPVTKQFLIPETANEQIKFYQIADLVPLVRIFNYPSADMYSIEITDEIKSSCLQEILGVFFAFPGNTYEKIEGNMSVNVQGPFQDSLPHSNIYLSVRTSGLREAPTAGFRYPPEEIDTYQYSFLYDHRQQRCMLRSYATNERNVVSKTAYEQALSLLHRHPVVKKFIKIQPKYSIGFDGWVGGANYDYTIKRPPPAKKILGFRIYGETDLTIDVNVNLETGEVIATPYESRLTLID